MVSDPKEERERLLIHSISNSTRGFSARPVIISAISGVHSTKTVEAHVMRLVSFIDDSNVVTVIDAPRPWG